MKYYRMVYAAKDTNNRNNETTGNFVHEYAGPMSQAKKDALLHQYVSKHQPHLKDSTVIACEEISKETYHLLLTSQHSK